MNSLSDSLNKMDISGANASDNITVIYKEDSGTNHSWIVDRALLWNSSTMIARMMKSGMKEAQTGEIEQGEFDVETVERMVSFVQHKEYKIEEEADLANDHEKSDAQPYMPPPVINDVLLAHVEMFKIADWYEIDELENYVVNSALMAHVAVYGIADFYDMENLRQYAWKRFNAAAQYSWQLDGFVDVVKEVYRISIRPSDGADLRYELCNYAMKHANQMSKLNNELSTDSQLQEFAAAMFQRSLWVKEAANDRKMEDLRKEMIAHQKTKTNYQEVNETLVRSNDALRGLINAVPSLGGDCSNPRCGVEFPANVRLLLQRTWAGPPRERHLESLLLGL